MTWQDKMKSIVAFVLNEKDTVTYFEVVFVGENGFKIEEVAFLLQLRNEVYRCEHLHLESHWREVVRVALMRIRQQEIDSAFERLDKIKDPVENRVFD